MKNRCFANIYESALNGDKLSKIHKKLYEMTINNQVLFKPMVKIANRAHKIVNRKKPMEDNILILIPFFRDMDKIKHIINHNLMEKAENQKQEVIKDYIKLNRGEEKYIYIASSHSDCAEDHKAWQGKLYYDEKAPAELVEYCKNRGMRSIQWVMGAPVYFITRPNCRHYFKCLRTEIVKQLNKGEIIRRYKTHRKEGDRALATPRKIAIDEYTDRLQMLKMMYNKKPSEYLRRAILKTELLLKKWKNTI